jgi:hypothetical protein
VELAKIGGGVASNIGGVIARNIGAGAGIQLINHAVNGASKLFTKTV